MDRRADLSVGCSLSDPEVGTLAGLERVAERLASLQPKTRMDRETD